MSRRRTGTARAASWRTTVNLHVGEDRIFGVFGHNGTGKTTVVNQLPGLVQPDSGLVVVAGENIVHDRQRGRYLCLVQPQGSAPLGELTLRAVVRIMARLHGVSKGEGARKTDELFERLGTASRADSAG